jgi:hypothetical protein
MKTASSPKHSLALLALSLLGFTASAALVQNPSFESDWNPVWPHYAPPAIEGWSGGTGLNDRSLDPGGPFWDNGKTPDRNRVVFKQQNGDISQDITGLTPGQAYWIQFYYNTRGDVLSGSCGIVTRFNGVDLDTISSIQRVTAPEGTGAITVPFHHRSVEFVPDTDSGTLTFHVATEGDRTALLDAVTIVPHAADAIVVMNPSFEASGILPEVGRITNAMAGWDGTGVFGVDIAGGAYANNGAIPDQDLVAFIEGPGSLAQTIKGMVVGSQYKLQFSCNARTGNTPHLQAKADSTVLFEGDITAVSGANPFQRKEVTFTAASDTIVLTFAQTQAGTDAVLLDDVRLIGKGAVVLPPMQVSPARGEIAPGQIVTVSVAVPSEKLALGPADITMATSDTNILRLVGAGADGNLVLHFLQNGATTQTLDAVGVRRGTASVNVSDSAGLTVPNNVMVHVVESFVRNPSFEAQQAASGAGYGAVLAWSAVGGVGLNRIDQAFAVNSGPIPDRLQVAFIQGLGSLSQELAGLTPGASYWLQFRYALRDFPDPAGPAIDLNVTLGGQPLVSIANIVPLSQTAATAYYATNVLFTPAAANATLRFATANAKGDATLLLDAVSIIRREAEDLVMQNPSFEASGAMDLYIEGPNTAPMAGWTYVGGGHGTASGGPFADNGTFSDQDEVLFLQGSGLVSQVVPGFTTGNKYTLIYSVNARGCCGASPILTHCIALAGTPGSAAPLFEEDISPAGGTRSFYRRFVVFTPDFSEQEIQFSHVTSEDRTLLLDNIRVIKGEVGAPPTPVIGLQGANPRISWPAPALGYVLQSAPTPDGPWSNDPALVATEGANRVATVQPDGAVRFFRLSL